MSKPLFMIFLILGSAFAAASAGAAPKQVTASEKTFRAIYPAAPLTLDPHAAFDPAAWPVILAAYHRLVSLAPGTADPVPALARRVVISPDGLKYTVVLNEGLTFADGTALNSEAALFSFDRLMSTPVGRRYYPHLRSFEIVGPYTFRMILSRPWPPFLASLALPPASLVSPGLRGRPADYLTRRTLGSGPYQVYDWQEATIGLQARPDLLAQPEVTFAMFHYEPDARQRLAKMAAHRAHLTVDPQFDPAALGGTYQVKKVPTFAVRYLAFNTRRPYTRMQNTRRALSLLIGRAFQNHPGRLDSPFPAGLFPDAPARTAAPALAAADPLEQGRAILREVGTPPGPLIMAMKSGDRSLAADARLIEQTLRPYGISLQVVTLEGTQGRRVMESGDYDLFLDTRTPDIPSADMWLGRFLDAKATVDGNPAFFRHDRANQLIQEIADTVGREGDGPNDLARVRAEQAAKVAELDDLARTEVPYAFLYQLEQSLVVDVRLMSLNPHPLWPDTWPLDQTSLKPFSFRSGVNPTGRPPGPPPEQAPANPAPPAAPAPAEAAPAPPGAPPPDPASPGARPQFDDFIGMELD